MFTLILWVRRFTCILYWTTLALDDFSIYQSLPLGPQELFDDHVVACRSHLPRFQKPARHGLVQASRSFLRPPLKRLTMVASYTKGAHIKAAIFIEGSNRSSDVSETTFYGRGGDQAYRKMIQPHNRQTLSEALLYILRVSIAVVILVVSGVLARQNIPRDLFFIVPSSYSTPIFRDSWQDIHIESSIHRIIIWWERHKQRRDSMPCITYRYQFSSG